MREHSVICKNNILTWEGKKIRLETSGPDVKLSWEYFQTVTLPNRVVKAGTKNEFRKMEPGEVAEGAEAYGVFDTPLNELGGERVGGANATSIDEQINYINSPPPLPPSPRLWNRSPALLQDAALLGLPLHDPRLRRSL